MEGPSKFHRVAQDVPQNKTPKAGGRSTTCGWEIEPWRPGANYRLGEGGIKLDTNAPMRLFAKCPDTLRL